MNHPKDSQWLTVWRVMPGRGPKSSTLYRRTFYRIMDSLTETKVRNGRYAVDRAEAKLTTMRRILARNLREAHKAGATIQQLMDWTGYSRRTIFYMLKDKD